MSTCFSIVIITKDRPHLLLRSVRSAIKNLTPLAEIIVIDDHSLIGAQESLCNISDKRLRVAQLPEGQSGVAAARNAGFDLAQGEVIFFLDDDDELEEGYCHHILSQASKQYDYGFSAYSQVNKQGLSTPRIRFEDGPIPVSAPLKKKICGFGMGFWIKREVAAQMGPVSTELTINEDTDYVCRLITAGKRAWYNATPCVNVYAGHTETTDIANMTKTIVPEERARCMRVVCDRFPHMVGHLGASYIRHCAKTGAKEEAWGFIRQQPGWLIKSRLSALLLVKLTARNLSTGLASS